MTESNHDVGNLGFGIVGGQPAEGQLFLNLVHGCFVANGTTPPAQLTGTGNGTFKYDISAGVVVVDGTSHDVPAAADTNLETPGNILADGESKVYAIVAWRHPETGVVDIKVIPGTKAITGSQVAPTTDEIEAKLMLGANWVKIGETTINRTGATTATQTGTTNKVRPLLVPVTVNRN